MNRLLQAAPARPSIAIEGTPCPATPEALAAERLREEWSVVDPATGLVLWAVDAQDVDGLEELRLVEELGAEYVYGEEIRA